MIIDIVLGKAIGHGGLEAVLTTVCQGLKNRGHRMRVFQMSPPDYEEWTSTLPEIYYYDPVRMGYTSAFHGEVEIFRFAMGYRQLISELGCPDIVIATHTPALSLICRLAMSHMGDNRPPILSWLHGPPEAFGGGSSLKYSDAHMAISRVLAKKIKKSLNIEVPIHYIGNPLGVEEANPVQKPKDNTLQLLYIGRISNQEKRLDVLFRALEHLRGEWNLRIIGHGHDVDGLCNLALELGISERIKWEGWIDKPWSIVTEASVLVLSSDYEGFGMVLVEALSRGIPVISSECGGPDEIVQHGQNGWLFPVGNYLALSDILQNILDGNLELPSSEQCALSIDGYRTEKVLDRMEQAFIYAKAYYNPVHISIEQKHPITIEIRVKDLIEELNIKPTMDLVSQLVKYVKEYSIEVESLIAFIDQFLNIEKKEDCFNLLGVAFWEHEMSDLVIPCFKKTLHLNPRNSDALYNLGSILSKYGEEKLALWYLNQIEEKNHEVSELIGAISGAQQNVSNDF